MPVLPGQVPGGARAGDPKVAGAVVRIHTHWGGHILSQSRDGQGISELLHWPRKTRTTCCCRLCQWEASIKIIDQWEASITCQCCIHARWGTSATWITTWASFLDFMMLTFNFIIDKFCLIRSKYKKRFTLTCCFCNLKSWAGLRPGCIPYIQVTWSVLTNQRPVFRSHDQPKPIRGQCYSPRTGRQTGHHLSSPQTLPAHRTQTPRGCPWWPEILTNKRPVFRSRDQY